MGKLLMYLEGTELVLLDSEDRNKRSELLFPETLIDYIDLDIFSLGDSFSEIADMLKLKAKRDENKKAIFDWAESMSKLHPFFLVQEYRMRKKFDDAMFYKEMQSAWYSAREYKGKSKSIIQKCLKVETVEKSAITKAFHETVSGSMVGFDHTLENYIAKMSYIKPEINTTYEICDGELREVLHPDLLSEIIIYCLRALLDRRQAFKVCKNCGGLFPVYSYKSTEYCDRLFHDTGKTCKEVGATRVYQNKVKRNPIIKVYNRAYKRNYAHIKYGKKTKEQFESWSIWARGQRDLCLEGKITLEEFEDFLDDIDFSRVQVIPILDVYIDKYQK